MRWRPLAFLAALGASVACAEPRQVAFPRYAPAPPPNEEAFRATPPSAPPVSEVIDAAPYETTLPNGLHVVLFERHGFPSVAAQLVIERGPADLDDPGAWQVSQALHLYGRGGSATALEPLRLAARNARLGYGSSASAVSWWAASESSDIGALLALLARASIGAQLDGTEYRLRAAEWASMASAHAISLGGMERSVLFGEQPYGYVWPGRQRISADDARSIHDRLFQPSQATLLVVGDVTSVKLGEAVAATFGPWTSGNPLPQKTDAPRHLSGPRVSIVPRYGRAQMVGAVFAQGPTPSSEDTAAFALLAVLLGGSPSSRLFEALRQESGDAYSAGAEVAEERMASWMTIGASYDPDKAVDGVATVLAAVRLVREGKVSEAEVQLAKENLLATWRSAMATAAGAASRYAHSIAIGAGLEPMRTFPERLARIGRDDLVRVAGRYLTDGTMHVLFVGDDRWLDTRALEMGGATTLDPAR